MQIETQSQGFALTHGLREYAEGRLRLALVRAGESVQRVAVRLYHVKGSRGERDKCCRIQMMLNRSAAVVIEETHADHYLAIYRATGRIGRNLMRRLARYEARPDYYPTGLATVPVY